MVVDRKNYYHASMKITSLFQVLKMHNVNDHTLKKQRPHHLVAYIQVYQHQQHRPTMV
jgi:hypothetical protein